MKQPPVPVGPRYPGAGGRIRLSIPADGRNVRLAALDGTKIDERVGDVIGRVAGLLVAGHEYPLFQEQILECWIREARPGFLKVDLNPTTIICASTLKSQERGRLLQAVLNSYRLSMAGPDETFAFIPIVKAGIFREVIYYIEAPSLPEVVFPDLVMDSLKLCHFLIAGPDSPAGIDDPGAYFESLLKGKDPQNLVAFEPLLRSLLARLPDEEQSEFVTQIGEQLRHMKSGSN